MLFVLKKITSATLLWPDIMIIAALVLLSSATSRTQLPSFFKSCAMLIRSFIGPKSLKFTLSSLPCNCVTIGARVVPHFYAQHAQRLSASIFRLVKYFLLN